MVFKDVLWLSEYQVKQLSKGKPIPVYREKKRFWVKPKALRVSQIEAQKADARAKAIAKLESRLKALRLSKTGKSISYSNRFKPRVCTWTGCKRVCNGKSGLTNHIQLSHTKVRKSGFQIAMEKGTHKNSRLNRVVAEAV